MADIMQLLPQVEPEERLFLANIVGPLPEDKARIFAAAYGAQRKDAQTVLICTIIGFLGVAGIQRFILGQIGMGLLYLFTAGLCWIGTIIDLVNHRKLMLEYNQAKAGELARTL
jgi:TM2 domain-containing membrane protein YozV